MGGWVGRSVGQSGVNSDAVGQVCDDVGLHQLAEELLLLGDVVRPGLREGDKSKEESAGCAAMRPHCRFTQLRALTLEFTQACCAVRTRRPRHLQPEPEAPVWCSGSGWRWDQRRRTLGSQHSTRYRYIGNNRVVLSCLVLLCSAMDR